MKKIYRRRLEKREVLTLPNGLSVFRMLLIPWICLCYLVWEKPIGAVLLILLSGLTDVLDGMVARKFGMISDLGKFLDPLADKLTLFALALCLVEQFPLLLLLLCVLAVKESAQFLFGLRVLQRKDRMESSKWFGKINTFCTYSVLILLFLFPNLPPVPACALILFCSALTVLSGVGYCKLFVALLHQKNSPSH